MHRVIALCLEGVVAFDLSAPAQAFSSASHADGLPLYEFSTCSLGAAPVRTTTGFAIAPQAGLEALAGAETIVVPGYAGVFDAPPAAVTEALAAAARRGARAISVCTGA